MAVEIKLYPGTLDHVALLAPVLRAADQRETLLAGSLSPEQALAEAVKVSSEVTFVTFDGLPACLFGVARVSEGVAAPWMLGSDQMAREPWRWLRIARQSVNRWRKEYPLLLNIVHSEHAASLRLLRWLGFNFGEPVCVEPSNAMFVPFWM